MATNNGEKKGIVSIDQFADTSVVADGQRGTHGNSCIDRGAARAQYVASSLCGHAVRAHDYAQGANVEVRPVVLFMCNT